MVARYRYDAWGKVVSILDADGVDISTSAAHIANINPFRYRGYYYDRETGLYYLQSRYYDPETGRFVNADESYALAGHYPNSHINLFSYCNNDCANESDFYGYGIMDYIHAIGIQLCLTVDGVNFGVEFLWSTKSWKLFVFVFSGLSTSRGLKSKKGASGATSLLKKGLGSIIKKPAKTPSAILKLFKRFSISVSVMAVIGSKKQKFPSSYCGAFTGFR